MRTSLPSLIGRTRRRLALALALSTTLLVGSIPAAAAAPGPDQLTVMTRNLYFGTDLGPVIAAQTQLEFFTRVAGALTQARASDFPARAKAWAAEIDAEQPDLIGVQEAVLWRTQSPADFSSTPNATHVDVDMLALLLTELRARGLHYDVVVTQDGYDVEAPGLFPTGFVDVRVTQREVILARRSTPMKLSNVQRGQYAARLSIPTIVGAISIPWAWASVDVSYRDHEFRFATTHLDSNVGVIQQLQAAEFLAGPGDTTLPVVWVGDFNSDAEGTAITGVPPATATYGSIISAGFSDAWDVKYPADPGLTCCQAADLRNPTSSLESRIDLVLTRGPLGVEEASIFGNDAGQRTLSGLWPSDHAGVTVTLELEGD